MDNIAWKKALMLRGCPPADVLFGAQQKHLRAHLDLCPMCQVHLAMDANEREGWNTLSRSFSPMKLPEPPIKPGQIWRIRRELAGWGPKNRYCNPPLVLLLKLLDKNLALVAQVFPGDAFLSDEDVTLPGLGFAQPWNTYALRLDDLEYFRGETTEVASVVLKRSQKSFADVAETSHLFLFRTLELEIGAFFARQSLARVLDLTPRQLLGSMTSGDIRRALMSKNQAISLNEDVPALLQLAFYAREDTAYGMAASSQRTRAVNYAVLDPLGMEIRQATITFSSVRYVDGVLILGGRINADFARALEMFAWWDTQERVIDAATADISDDGLYFNLRFVGLNEREFHFGRLMALLSGHATGG